MSMREIALRIMLVNLESFLIEQKGFRREISSITCIRTSLRDPGRWLRHS